MAALYYLADRETGRVAFMVPRFRRGNESPPGSAMEIKMDDDTFRAVEVQAGLHGVTPAWLVEHAVLYLLADLHSGRLVPSLDDRS